MSSGGTEIAPEGFNGEETVLPMGEGRGFSDGNSEEYLSVSWCAHLVEGYSDGGSNGKQI